MSHDSKHEWAYGLAFLSVIFAYELIFNLSNVLGLSWVNRSSNWRTPYIEPSVEGGVISFFLAFFCLIPALYCIDKEIDARLAKEEITKTDVKNIYIRYACIYILCVIATIFLLPIWLNAFRL